MDATELNKEFEGRGADASMRRGKNSPKTT